MYVLVWCIICTGLGVLNWTGVMGSDICAVHSLQVLQVPMCPTKWLRAGPPSWRRRGNLSSVARQGTQ